MKLSILSTHGVHTFTFDDDISFEGKQLGVNKGYLNIKSRRMVLGAHRYVMGDLPTGAIIDHINQDVTDNRRSNLRVVTKAQNAWNRKRNSNTKSKYRGVYKRTRSNRTFYSASICHKRKLSHIGDFDDEIVAAPAWNSKCIELRGQHGVINEC